MKVAGRRVDDAVTRVGELEPIARSNRRQAWTVGAHWALANRWEGRSYAA